MIIIIHSSSILSTRMRAVWTQKTSFNVAGMTTFIRRTPKASTRSRVVRVFNMKDTEDVHDWRIKDMMAVREFMTTFMPCFLIAPYTSLYIHIRVHVDD